MYLKTQVSETPMKLAQHCSPVLYKHWLLPTAGCVHSQLYQLYFDIPGVLMPSTKFSATRNGHTSSAHSALALKVCDLSADDLKKKVCSWRGCGS